MGAGLISFIVFPALAFRLLGEERAVEEAERARAAQALAGTP